jgi:hypothetical protein
MHFKQKGKRKHVGAAVHNRRRAPQYHDLDYSLVDLLP